VNDGHSSEELLVVPALVALAVGFVLYWAGRLAALIAGTRHLHGRWFAEFGALEHFGDPSLAWHANVGPPAVYWLLQLLGLVVAAGALSGGWWLVRELGGKHSKSGRSDDPEQAPGLASRREVKRAASAQALLKRAQTLRPSVKHPRPQDVGVTLGAARKLQCWASVEDSVTVIGPPRHANKLTC
jgi:type IV secretion system protein VirD4